MEETPRRAGPSRAGPGQRLMVPLWDASMIIETSAKMEVVVVVVVVVVVWTCGKLIVALLGPCARHFPEATRRGDNHCAD